MRLKEALQRKAEAEDEILDVLHRFHQDTGLHVTGLGVDVEQIRGERDEIVCSIVRKAIIVEDLP